LRVTCGSNTRARHPGVVLAAILTGVPNVMSLRRRLPLIVWVLLVIVVLMLLGFACACLTDDPMQAVERALSFVPALPTPAPWSGLAVALGAMLLVVAQRRAVEDRASPALLQRFLF